MNHHICGSVKLAKYWRLPICDFNLRGRPKSSIFALWRSDWYSVVLTLHSCPLSEEASCMHNITGSREDKATLCIHDRHISKKLELGEIALFQLLASV